MAADLIISNAARISGNTDCKMYYNLTKNVYRFMGPAAGSSFGAVSRRLHDSVIHDLVFGRGLVLFLFRSTLLAELGLTGGFVRGSQHTVDEKFALEGFYSILRWINAIVQNADEYDGEE